eukprot:4547027-Amphidinium_carterae.1
MLNQNSAIEVVSQGSSTSTGALSSCESIHHSHLLLMPGLDRQSDEGYASSGDSSSSGYSSSTMEQEQPTAKAEAVPEPVSYTHLRAHETEADL